MNRAFRTILLGRVVIAVYDTLTAILWAATGISGLIGGLLSLTAKRNA